MPRRTVEGHCLYSQHALESGVEAPFSERGRDAATGAEGAVLNPGQGVASQRALANRSLGHPLDIDTSFVFENGANHRCKHIRILQTGIAIRCRMLPQVAKYFKIGNEDYHSVLRRVGSSFEKPNYYIMSLSRDYIQKGALPDSLDDHGSSPSEAVQNRSGANNIEYGKKNYVKDFDKMTIESVRLEFKNDLKMIKSSHRHTLGSRVEGYIHSEYFRIQRLQELHQTAKDVVNHIKALHSSVAAGQTPDLRTVERIVHTPQKYDEMPQLLFEAAFHGMVDPTRIFLDFTAHAEILQVAVLLGQANLGLIAPTKRQSRAFLREIMGEGSEDILPFHIPMRAQLLSQIENVCDWRRHRESIARICREVIDDVRPEGVVERRQLWKIH